MSCLTRIVVFSGMFWWKPLGTIVLSLERAGVQGACVVVLHFSRRRRCRCGCCCCCFVVVTVIFVADVVVVA